MRNRSEIKREWRRWQRNAASDRELLAELGSMREKDMEAAFYKDLSFGTGGLRGIMGAGTDRMNVVTVAKASQGVADHLLAAYETPSVVIGYDSRNKSDVFARTAASVFAANGVAVWLWPHLSPVPTVSFAVRHLHASQGVMITASHNSAEYNGYKVYGSDGCQITTEAAEAILTEISKLDIFADVRTMTFEKALAEGSVRYIDPSVLTAYLEAVKARSVLFGETVDKDISIVYTPLNGAGLIPVTRILSEAGFSNITVVEEQRLPDGNFPTCPYPNPEVRETMEPGLAYCRKVNADLMVATDPDGDRCGIAVRNGNEYSLLSGNEVGLLLLDFICSQRTKHDGMPARPVFIKTIVTTELAERIAARYGCRTVNVLTGFKFIGEQIGRLEEQGREGDFVCGFEESCGYLTGTYVRDKDAVNAVLMICEMFACYKTRGISLIGKLEELYEACGYCLNTLHSYQFPGPAGMETMGEIMTAFRAGITQLAEEDVVRTIDYSEGINGLPAADVMKYLTEHFSLVIRPSGTEPKLKAYIGVRAEDRKAAAAWEERIKKEVEKKIQSASTESPK